jgi:sugar/nucleoside kinase (ribokinase family)
MPELAVIGSLSVDVVEGETRVGGGAFHAARALRLLPVEAIVVTRADELALTEPLAALGVPFAFRESKATARFSFSYDGDVRHMQIDAVGEPWTPDDIRGWAGEAIGDARWVQVSPLMRSDFDEPALAELARGRRLLLDGQGLVRRSEPGPLVLDADFDPGVLRHVTVLKLAEEEAQIVVGETVDAETLARLGVPEILVTFGSRGSLVYADGEMERLRGRPVAADATGAGDAFAAAYLAGRACDAPPLEAARSATDLVESLLAAR